MCWRAGATNIILKLYWLDLKMKWLALPTESLHNLLKALLTSEMRSNSKCHLLIIKIFIIIKILVYCKNINFCFNINLFQQYRFLVTKSKTNMITKNLILYLYIILAFKIFLWIKTDKKYFLYNLIKYQFLKNILFHF